MSNQVGDDFFKAEKTMCCVGPCGRVPWAENFYQFNASFLQGRAHPSQGIGGWPDWCIGRYNLLKPLGSRPIYDVVGSCCDRASFAQPARPPLTAIVNGAVY